MSYTKGSWHVGGNDKCTVYDEFSQRIANSFEGVMVIKRSDEQCRENANRIVNCVNACAGMDDPAKEIAELQDAVSKLKSHLVSCANELTFMIDEHNEQSMEDGSWKYDHQTPWEAMFLIEKMKAK